MNQKNRKLWTGAAVLVSMLILAVLFLRREPSIAPPSENEVAAPKPPALPEVALPEAPPVHDDGEIEDPPPGEQPSEADFIDYFRNKFGPGIRNKYVQIKAIEKLIEYLTKLYPNDWRARLYDFLKEAFPELADELYAQFEKLDRYNDWVRNNRHELMKLSAKDRRAALWDMRYSFFGEDAHEIWAVALKNERILESLETIAESRDTTVDQKVDAYVNAIRQAYGDRTDELLQNRNTELMNRFLSAETVQDDLHSLAPAERQQKLHKIRRAMGMDDEALARWDELDAYRDRIWSAGERYMREREQLAQQYQGADLESRLAPLREQLFGPQEAQIIGEEEQTGFLRFARRRRFGRE